MGITEILQLLLALLAGCVVGLAPLVWLAGVAMLIWSFFPSFDAPDSGKKTPKPKPPPSDRHLLFYDEPRWPAAYVIGVYWGCWLTVFIQQYGRYGDVLRSVAHAVGAGLVSGTVAVLLGAAGLFLYERGRNLLKKHGRGG